MKYILALDNVISSTNRTFRTSGGLAEDVLLIVTGQPVMGTVGVSPSILYMMGPVVPLI